MFHFRVEKTLIECLSDCADTAEADDAHDRLSLVGGDGHGLILIDQELGKDAEGH